MLFSAHATWGMFVWCAQINKYAMQCRFWVLQINTHIEVVWTVVPPIIAQCKVILIYQFLRSFMSSIAACKSVTCVSLHLQTNTYTPKTHTVMTVRRFWVMRYLHFISSVSSPNDNILSTPSELIMVLNLQLSYLFEKVYPQFIIPVKKVRLNQPHLNIPWITRN